MKKNLKRIIILIVLLSTIVALLLYINNLKPKQEVIDNGEDINEIIEEEEIKYDLDALKKLWQENKKINDDYVGNVIFDSGIINEPFVQGETNESYIRTDWETMSNDDGGTIFMDYLNNLDDKNIILYGHYVYPKYDEERIKLFTPLERLLQKENYEDNKYAILVLENEVREYEVAVVYYCQLYYSEELKSYAYADDKTQYYWANIGDVYFDYEDRTISKEYFDLYKSTIEEKRFYDTDIDFSIDDNFLTLQTCVYQHDDKREIVFLKEIKRYKYND